MGCEKGYGDILRRGYAFHFPNASDYRQSSFRAAGFAMYDSHTGQLIEVA